MLEEAAFEDIIETLSEAAVGLAEIIWGRAAI